ncbi:MAG TPA: adenylate/guanylate cyclase domain-containing protein [Actinomycetota bacterium]|nr:adenylate/guanylate cyclase domain-containing protein [Actinomycetota bacterium]
MGICGRCGEDNPERARFCLACGTELERAAGLQSRKVITVLFADVVSSTALAERLDPEALREVMNRCFHVMRTAVERHGGVVEKFVGDAVMAVFGVPTVREDDALRAVRAGLDMQQAIRTLDVELRDRLDEQIQIRVGINTGEVIVGADLDRPASVIGDAVNAAARLEKLAPPGGVVIGGPTCRLVGPAVIAEPLGDVDLRGRTERLEALLVSGLRDEIATRRFETNLVGRTRELEALMRAFDGVVEDGTCALFTVLGTAGVGKSRLTREFLDKVQDRARVLRGRCLSYGDGITMWPIAEALGDAAEISDSDSQEDALGRLTDLIAMDEDAKTIANVVGQAIGLGEATAGQEETFWAIRRYLEILARRQPLVVVFDDIHWAEPAFLDLVDHVVEWTQDSPLMVLCLARHELLEERPTWGGGKLNSTTVNLEPLKSDDAADLFASLLGKPAAPDLTAILEASGGNPLFLEETIGMLIDDGVIVESDDTWATTRDITQVMIPPTIQALLSARIERLPREERSVIEVAAVVGKVFSTEAVVGLTGSDDVKDCLLSVHRKGVIQREPGAGGEELFRFRHILIRDAAYNGLPKQTRADLHARYAEWAAETLGDRVIEYEEIIGYHFEQAHSYRSELGIEEPPGSRTNQLAARYLADGGRRGLGRGDINAARTLLSRAASLLDDDDAERARTLLDLGEALWEHGDYEASETILNETIVLAQRAGDRVLEARARLSLDECHIHSRPDKSVEETIQLSEQAIKTFTDLGDHVGLAYAWRLLSWAYDSLGQSGKSQDALKQAIQHAHASGDTRRESQYRRVEIQSLSWGPIHLGELRAKVADFLTWARTNGERRAEALGSAIQAVIEACEGNFEQARRLIARQRAIHMEMGLEMARAWSVFEATKVEMLAGDLAAAEAELRWSCETLRSKNEKAVLPTVLAVLADVRCTRGDIAEAERLVDHALQITVDDDVLTQAVCRTVLARVRTCQGRYEEGLGLINDAIRHIEPTEFLDWRANTWMDAAHIYRTTGNRDRAADAVERAIKYYEQKGMDLPAQRAKQWLSTPV